MSPPLPAPSLGPKTTGRMLRAETAIALTIFIAVALSAFVVSAGPRLAEEVAKEDLRHTLTESEPEQRNIRVLRTTRIGAGPIDDPYLRVTESGDRFLGEVPEIVGSAISDHRWVMDSPRLIVDPMPGEAPLTDDTTIRFRAQQGVEDHIRVIEGEMPSAQDPVEMLLGPDCPVDVEEREQFEPNEELACDFQDVPVYQVAVSAETAEDLHLTVGERALLRPDLSDGLFGRQDPARLNSTRIILEVSAIIELDPLEDEFWHGENVLHLPRTFENSDFRFVFATGLVSGDVYTNIFRDLRSPNMAYTWRYEIDPEGVSPNSAATLAARLREYQSNLPSPSVSADHLEVVTGLPRLIDEFEAQRAQALAMMSTTVAGVVVLTGALVLTLAALVSVRERESIVLARGRGASAGQLTVTKFYQGLALTVPAVVLGYFTAELVLPATEDRVAQQGAYVLFALAILAILFAALPLITRDLGALLGDRAGSGRQAARRVVVEALVIALAAGSIISLRRRGNLDPSVRDPGQVDLLLAVAPALIAFVGLRRIARQTGIERLPMVVIVLALGLLAFGSVVGDTIDATQRDVALQAVGADYALVTSEDEGVFVGEVDPGVVDGVEAFSFGAMVPSASVDVGEFNRTVPLMAIDVIPHNEVLQRAGADLALGDELIKRSPDAGTAQDPIPVLVSSTWPGGPAPAIGTSGSLFLETKTIFIEVVGTTEAFPGLEPGSAFVIADLGAIRVANAPTPVRPNRAWIIADQSIGDELATELESQTPGVRLVSRYAALGEVTGDPFIAWIGRGLLVLTLITALFATVAAVASLSIAAARRRRDLAFMRTMGLRTSQATALTFIEQVPMVFFAVVGGVLAGVGVVWAVGPALELAAFTGGSTPGELAVSWAKMARLGTGVVVVLTAAVIIFALSARRDDVTRALRLGDN